MFSVEWQQLSFAGLLTVGRNSSFMGVLIIGRSVYVSV